MMTYGLLGVELDTHNDAPTVALKEIPFHRGIQWLLCVNIAHNITPVNHCPFGIDLLRACHKHFHTSGAPGANPAGTTSGDNAMSQFCEVK